MRPYLDGGGLVKTDSLDIFHDLWITPKGLEESTARFGNGPLLAFLLQVIHKDIVILFSLWGGETHTHTQISTTLAPFWTKQEAGLKTSKSSFLMGCDQKTGVWLASIG